MFEGLDENSNLSVKVMKARFAAYEAEKNKKESDLLTRLEQMDTMLKSLGSAASSGANSGSQESFNQVSHDYPKNTSPMPHINHSGNVPYFDGTHFSFWKSSMESHICGCSVELWEIIADGYMKPHDPTRLTSIEFYNRQLNASVRDKIRSAIHHREEPC